MKMHDQSMSAADVELPEGERPRQLRPGLIIAVDDAPTLDGQNWLTFADYLRHPDSVARLLSQAWRARQYAVCGCSDGAPRVALRRLHSGAVVLVRFPGTGQQHAAWCPLNGPTHHPSLARAQRMAAIEQRSDGTFVVTVRKAAQANPENNCATLPTDGRQTLASTAATSRLLGLLEYVAWEGHLHHVDPGVQRSYTTLYDCLRSGARHGFLRIERAVERPLLDLLYVLPRYRPAARLPINAQFERFITRRENADFLMICGEVRKIEPAGDSWRVFMRHLDRELIMRTQVLARAIHSYRVARAAVNRTLGRCRALVIAQVRLGPGGTLLVFDSAWQLLSYDYVVSDSRYEARLADVLVVEKRAFYKPLSRDLVSDGRGGAVLPDVILTDTSESAWGLEVRGINSVPYQHRFCQKGQIYGRVGMPLWIWDAWRDRDIPPLPPRAP